MRPLADESTLADAGGKGASLAWLRAHGYQVPQTWVVPPGTEPSLDQLDPNKAYAVRSSANVEDGGAASFAGQFLTRLDVTGVEAVGAAVAAVRASADTTGVDSYSAHMGAADPIEMSVLIQEMVTPVASGVVFTRNPITGLNEVVLEAVAGRGDLLVGRGATPQRWVRRWGAWTQEPTDPSLPADVAATLVDQAMEIGEAYGRPADLEWVWDGHDIWWLQIRPITGVGDVAVYSNRISKEVMPGLIKPLVWSVNVPVVNRAWIELFTEAIGPNDVRAADLAKSFAYRSYFNMGAIGDIFELVGMPRDSLELLLGLPEGPDKPTFKPTPATIRKLPRLLTFAARQARYGGDTDRHLRGLRAEYGRFGAPLEHRSDAELLEAVDKLMELGTRAAYANIVVPLLANIYTALLRKRLARRGIDLATVDIVEDLDAGRDDLDSQLDELAGVMATAGVDSPEATAELSRFIERFGHFSDSGNDFSVASWREQPELLKAMAAARGSTSRRSVRKPWSEVRRHLGPIGRVILGLVRRRAARYQARREQVSSLYTYGYGLFRNYFLELGKRLADRGIIADADDIMFLTLDEVRAGFAGELVASAAHAIVSRHRAEMAKVVDVAMPEIIYGDGFIATGAAAGESILRGVATSRGHYRGPVRVVTGLSDFGKVQPGDVLAIPFSDVGWTPLFDTVKAIVAESGGMLSHSSIVAREYGIPCVVSVPGATALEDGVMVTVDGYRGEVICG